MKVRTNEEKALPNETKKLERSKLNGREGKLCLLSQGDWNERDKVEVVSMETSKLERKRRGKMGL